MKDTVIPLAVPGPLRSQIVNASKRVSLTQAEVMRQSMRIGLPHLIKALEQADEGAKTPQRVVSQPKA